MTILELIVDCYNAGYKDGIEEGVKDGIAYQLDMLKMREGEEQDD